MPHSTAEKRRAYDAQRAAEAREAALHCPECGKRRRTLEALRAHRGIAHGVTAAADH